MSDRPLEQERRECRRRWVFARKVWRFVRGDHDSRDMEHDSRDEMRRAATARHEQSRARNKSGVKQFVSSAWLGAVQIGAALVLGTPVWAGSGRSENKSNNPQNSSCILVASRYFGCVRTSSPNSQAARLLKVGSIVSNFGAVARVELLTERGALLTIIPWTRDGVAQGGVGQRYYADPGKCEEVAP